MYTIQQVSTLTGLAPSTIRYYDKQGILPFVERTPSGYRSFSEKDIQFLKFIDCLKKTGMPIKEIRSFTRWLEEGDATLQQRYHMFLERREAVLEQIAQLNKALELIEHKCWYYKTALEAGTEAIHKGEKID